MRAKLRNNKPTGLECGGYQRAYGDGSRRSGAWDSRGTGTSQMYGRLMEKIQRGLNVLRGCDAYHRVVMKGVFMDWFRWGF